MAMFGFPTALKIYLGLAPVDMRKQYDGLWSMAQEQLGEDPKQGALFVFTNKGRDRVKMLYWDGSGVWVFAKRLEKGRFSWPQKQGAAKLLFESAALTMLLSGIELKDGCRKAWYER